MSPKSNFVHFSHVPCESCGELPTEIQETWGLPHPAHVTSHWELPLALVQREALESSVTSDRYT